MNIVDIVVIVVILAGVCGTGYLMKKKREDHCSGTCLGCSLEKTCSTKNLKKLYDSDNK